MVLLVGGGFVVTVVVVVVTDGTDLRKSGLLQRQN